MRRPRLATVGVGDARTSSGLSDLESFKRVLAPFDGVVTARNTDVGYLINAGQAPGTELFRMADIHKLRIYAQVPEAYAAATETGRKGGAALRRAARQEPTRPRPCAHRMRSIRARARCRWNCSSTTGGGALSRAPIPRSTSSSRQARETLRLPANTVLFRAGGLQVAVVAESQTRSRSRSIESGPRFRQDDRSTDGPRAERCGRRQSAGLHRATACTCASRPAPWKAPTRAAGARLHERFDHRPVGLARADGVVRRRRRLLLRAALHGSRHRRNLPSNTRSWAGWKIAQPQDAQPRGVWWTLYGDPRARPLGGQDSGFAILTLKAAFARLQQARAQYRIARADLFPSLTADPYATREKLLAERPEGAARLSDLAATIFSWVRISPTKWTCGAGCATKSRLQRRTRQASAADLASVELRCAPSSRRTISICAPTMHEVQLLDRTVEDLQRGARAHDRICSTAAPPHLPMWRRHRHNSTMRSPRRRISGCNARRPSMRSRCSSARTPRCSVCAIERAADRCRCRRPSIRDCPRRSSSAAPTLPRPSAASPPPTRRSGSPAPPISRSSRSPPAGGFESAHDVELAVRVQPFTGRWDRECLAADVRGRAARAQTAPVKAAYEEQVGRLSQYRAHGLSRRRGQPRRPAAAAGRKRDRCGRGRRPPASPCNRRRIAIAPAS